MKKIMPSLREKNRYIAYTIKTSKALNEKNAKKAMYDEIVRKLGELEAAKASLLILDDFKEGKGIIKVNNKYKDKVISALMLINELEGSNVNIETQGVSGTIKKLRRKFTN